MSLKLLIIQRIDDFYFFFFSIVICLLKKPEDPWFWFETSHSSGSPTSFINIGHLGGWACEAVVGELHTAQAVALWRSQASCRKAWTLFWATNWAIPYALVLNGCFSNNIWLSFSHQWLSFPLCLTQRGKAESRLEERGESGVVVGSESRERRGNRVHLWNSLLHPVWRQPRCFLSFFFFNCY